MFDFDVLRISADGAALDEVRPPGTLGLGTIVLNGPISDVPRGPALTLAPEATVAAAIEAMRRRARPAVVVVRQQRPLGVVTDRDILAHACSEIDELAEVPLEAVMSTGASPVRADEPVGVVLRRMCGLRQWHMPIVCDQGLLIGSLDVTDILQWLRDRITLLSVDAALG